MGAHLEPERTAPRARTGSRPTKVATLLSVPAIPGSGLGTFVLGLFDRLRQHDDLELVLIAPEVERGAAGRRASQMLLAARQVRQLVSARPDVVHVHDHPVLLGAAVAYRALSGGRVRVVFSSHLDPAGPRARWKRVALGRLFRYCSAVTVVAQDSANKLPLFAEPVPGPDVVRIVPGAADVLVRERSDPAVRAFAASIGHVDGPVLLQVSNFTYPAKVAGTLRLIQAMADVKACVPNVRLICLGTGPLIGRAQAELERLGLQDCVTLPARFIEDLSLPAGLADVHCHITGQDGCPISILEAMHAGKPIVASRIGGIPEIIEDGVTGRLVGDDAREIAQRIVELLAQPERARLMGARARALAQARFTWDRVAADVAALYRQEPAPAASRFNEVLPVGR